MNDNRFAWVFNTSFAFFAIANIFYFIIERDDWLLIAVIGAISMGISTFVGNQVGDGMHQRLDKGYFFIAFIFYIYYVCGLLFFVEIILQRMDFVIFISASIIFFIGYWLGIEWKKL